MITVVNVHTDNPLESRKELAAVLDRVDNIILPVKCLMAIDGSTDITGVSLISMDNSNPLVTIAFIRSEETAVAYKVRLKRAIETIIKNNLLITDIFYEEPFIEFIDAATNLLMLRTLVEELIVENEPRLDYIKYIEINNKKWKRIWLAPSKVPDGTVQQKSMVKEKLVKTFPIFLRLTQDEVDATAMGLAANMKLKEGSEESLRSKRKTRPFNYNTFFMATGNEDILLSELMEIKGIPRIVMMNGISLIDMGPREKIDNIIMSRMGDEDKLLAIRFNPRHHGNILLKYDVGYLAEEGEPMYALVWRKTRKR